jgi:hypothetical protein
VVNGPVSQSTSVPQVWSDKQQAIRIIGEGQRPVWVLCACMDTFDLWSMEDRIRELGGHTLETQLIVSGAAHGPAGQWLSFAFQDLSKDKEGRFSERLRPADDSFGQPNTIRLSYGANGLLQNADREEFKKRQDPFKGVTPPAPLES